jgi:hypothetical protein
VSGGQSQPGSQPSICLGRRAPTIAPVTTVVWTAAALSAKSSFSSSVAAGSAGLSRESADLMPAASAIMLHNAWIAAERLM